MLPLIRSRWTTLAVSTLALIVADDSPSPSSKQAHKLVDAKPCLPNDGTQGPSIKFLVVRHDDLCQRVIAPQHNMTTFLSLENEFGLFKGFDAFSARNPR